mmetsp:Transcript_10244/g.22574  ORF Transcript_10244/g.22574 Transcript_10244/m.22574 type:complete len:307 (-) Transcript_10244:464-1384(-)
MHDILILEQRVGRSCRSKLLPILLVGQSTSHHAALKRLGVVHGGGLRVFGVELHLLAAAECAGVTKQIVDLQVGEAKLFLRPAHHSEALALGECPGQLPGMATKQGVVGIPLGMGPPVRSVTALLGIQGGNPAQADVELDCGAQNSNVRLLECLAQQLEGSLRPLEADVKILLGVSGGAGAHHRVPLIPVLGVHCSLRNGVFPLGPFEPLILLEAGSPHQSVSFPGPKSTVVLSPVSPLPPEAEQLVHVVPGFVQLVTRPLLEGLPPIHLIGVVHAHISKLQGIRDRLSSPHGDVLGGAQGLPQLL